VTNRLNIIPWQEFQKGIAPLWNTKKPSTIPIFNNPYGIIQYKLSDCKDIIYFPCEYVVDNEVVGYISIYNLSEMHIRPRGIYIKPEFRGKGLGHQMQLDCWNLFPKSFYRAFIWSRAENVERFCKHSNMNVLPGGGNIWSEFGQDFQSLLYNERSNYPNDISKEYNIHFLQTNKEEYSLGGTNNLNVSWSNDEWLNYFETHKGNYQELNLNLDL
jgi:GNAT superfamily N-acetyltransferase